MKREYIGVKDPVGENMYVQYITDTEIVRCENCKHRRDLTCALNRNCAVRLDDFCSRGERNG